MKEDWQDRGDSSHLCILKLFLLESEFKRICDHRVDISDIEAYSNPFRRLNSMIFFFMSGNDNHVKKVQPPLSTGPKGSTHH